MKEFSRRDALKIFGGAATALILGTSCSDRESGNQRQEPLAEWSTIDVPPSKTIYLPLDDLDKSPLGISDLFVYSVKGEPLVFFAAVLKTPNHPKIFEVNFFLKKYKAGFNIDDDNDLLGLPERDSISDQVRNEALNDILSNIPQNSNITRSRPIEVIMPITKPADTAGYIFTYKSKIPDSNLRGFIPLKFTFGTSLNSAV